MFHRRLVQASLFILTSLSLGGCALTSLGMTPEEVKAAHKVRCFTYGNQQSCADYDNMVRLEQLEVAKATDAGQNIALQQSGRLSAQRDLSVQSHGTISTRADKEEVRISVPQQKNIPLKPESQSSIVINAPSDRRLTSSTLSDVGTLGDFVLANIHLLEECSGQNNKDLRRGCQACAINRSCQQRNALLDEVKSANVQVQEDRGLDIGNNFTLPSRDVAVCAAVAKSCKAPTPE